MKQNDLFEKLSKLRLIAAVVYDKGTALGLSEEEKNESIEPIRHSTDELIKAAMNDDLAEIVGAVKGYEEAAALDMKRAERYREKASEAHTHAEHIKNLLKHDMLKKSQTERIQGNYMAVIAEGKLELR